MVFPSRGCQTCRKRRVKCDAVQPDCGRCKIGGRTCTWDPNDQAGLHWKSENEFAQGRPRRPRGTKEPSPEPSAPGIPDTLSTPIEIQAFHYWAENFTFQLEDLPDIGREYNSYVLYYWNRAPTGSSLHLALSALSHAVFGRAKQLRKVIADAEILQAQTVVSTKNDMKDVSNETIDQLLVAIMLMGYCENILYRNKNSEMEGSPSCGADDVGSQFWKDVCHHKGASGLLKLRRQDGYDSNLPLDRAVRRQLIRTIILRGVTIPEWIVNGSEYGEESPALEVDSIMVRVANLRARSLTIFSAQDSGVSFDPHQLKILAGDADELNTAMASWPQTLPEEWQFSTQYSPTENSDPVESGFLYSGISHVYASHGHAVVWNRYRAVRLLVNSICLRSLSMLLQISLSLSCASQPHPSANLRPLVIAQQNVCRKNIESATTELCGSVPFFFNSPNTSGEGKVFRTIKIGSRVVVTEHEILPKMAGLLAWPVAIAIRTEGVPEPQRQWLRSKLKIAASSMGDAMLNSVIENEEFKF